LGIGRFKWELEDLAFKHLEPEAYRQMQDLVAEKRADREARLANVTETLKAGLEQAGIEYLDISGRPKHLYGIYQKMQRQQRNFMKFDLAAIRILKTNEECYLWQLFTMPFDRFRPV